MNTLTAQEISARTPATRNRVVDFLRVAALLVVVVGHYLMAAVVLRDGELAIGPPSDPAWAKLLTWAFQVMPVFFVVGGYANRASWRSAQRKGIGYGAWVRERARRLAVPALVVAAVWVPLAALVGAFGVDRAMLRDATQIVAVPMWFLAVYLMVVAAAPALLALHERHGTGVVLVLAAAALGLDVAHRAFGIRFTGAANYLPVWLAVHQLGFFWGEGRLDGLRRFAGRIAASVLAVMVALTVFGPYPLAMVGVGAGDGSNNSPPTILMILLGMAQLALVLRFEPALQGWLERPRVWAAVVRAAAVSMTVYLWHMTVLVLVVGALWFLESPLLAIEPLSAGWGATRPLWLAVLLAGLVPVVWGFSRFERPAPSAPVHLPVWRAALGVGLAALAIGRFAFVGMHAPGMPLGLPLLGIGAAALAVPLLALRSRPGAGAPATG